MIAICKVNHFKGTSHSLQEPPLLDEKRHVATFQDQRTTSGRLCGHQARESLSCTIFRSLQQISSLSLSHINSTTPLKRKMATPQPTPQAQPNSHIVRLPKNHIKRKSQICCDYINNNCQMFLTSSQFTLISSLFQP